MSSHVMFHRLATILLLSLISPSPTVLAQDTSNRRPQNAGKFRSSADLAMSERRFDDAIKYYKQAVEIEPKNALNYYKLFRVHNRMNKLESALTDLTTALQYEPSKDEYRQQRAKLLVSLGQCDRAVEDYILMNNSDPPNEQKARACAAEISSATKAFTNGDYDHAYILLNSVLQKTERADDLLFMKAEAAFHIGEYYTTVSDTARIIKNHGNHLDAYKLRGDAYYRLGENDMAINHYREALKLDPEHKGCKAGHRKVKNLVKKVNRATQAMEEKRFEDALNYWRQAVELDVTHSAFSDPTLLQIAICLSALGQHDDALETIDNYMMEVGESVESYIALGDALMVAERYDEAMKAFQNAYEESEDGENIRDIQERMQKAETALKQSKQKNYYKILNVSRTATSKEIKKSYREMALKWHPDKNTDNTEEAEKMFQDISEANEVLSSDELRGRYDRGEDVFENQGGGGHHDPRQHFSQHFSHGGGGQKFSFSF